MFIFKTYQNSKELNSMYFKIPTTPLFPATALYFSTPTNHQLVNHSLNFPQFPFKFSPKLPSDHLWNPTSSLISPHSRQITHLFQMFHKIQKVPALLPLRPYKIQSKPSLPLHFFPSIPLKIPIFSAYPSPFQSKPSLPLQSPSIPLDKPISTPSLISSTRTHHQNP